jgi:hypothetical protein
MIKLGSKGWYLMELDAWEFSENISRKFKVN